MFKGLGFTFPTSGGTLELDFGFRPQVIMFMGGNQDVEDVCITPANPGVFFGMSWIDHFSGLVDSQALSNIYHGVAFSQVPIHQAGASGTIIDYRAEMQAFTDTGCVLNITHPAPGYRPIHVLAIGDQEGAGGTTDFSTDNKHVTIPLGYRATTGLMFHMFIADTGRELFTDGGIYYSMGVANYQEGLENHSGSNAQAMTMLVHTSLGSVGFTLQDVQGYGYISKTVRPSGAGSYLNANDHLYPVGVGGYDIHYDLWGYNTRHVINWWTANGHAQYLGGAPDLGVVHNYSNPTRVPGVEAALIFGTLGYSTYQMLGPPVAYMYGVCTPDYQGCVAFDAGRHYLNVHDPAFVQSTQYCYVDRIHSGSGFKAARGDINGAVFSLTGEIDTAGPGAFSGSMVQLYGEGSGASPGFFRVLHK